MQINGYNPYTQTKTNIKNLNQPAFLGYFACPIKEIHMQPTRSIVKVMNELHQNAAIFLT